MMTKYTLVAIREILNYNTMGDRKTNYPFEFDGNKIFSKGVISYDLEVPFDLSTYQRMHKILWKGQSLFFGWVSTSYILTYMHNNALEHCVDKTAKWQRRGEGDGRFKHAN